MSLNFDKNFKNLIARLVQTNQNDDTRRRQELILNILLLSSIFFLVLINLIRFFDFLEQAKDRGLPLIFTLLILLLFIGIYYLSRRGHLKAAACLFILAYTLPTFYFAYNWGADLPAALLLAVLIIIIAGVLVGSRLAAALTLFIAGAFLGLTYLQENKLINFNPYWREESNEVADMLAYVIILGVISIIAWLYAREIEKSLARARRSEAALKDERDQLEIKVIARTKEIRDLEMEKITQLYRLAEFGRLSSGIFHDLINPLTAVALNLEELKKLKAAGETTNYLDQAFKATRKMENFIISIKKQIQGDKSRRYFSITEEILETEQILNYKIQKAQIEIKNQLTPDLKLYGDPLKFNQVIANLLSNAADACQENTSADSKIIIISASKLEQEIIIKIQDNGPGIKPENENKIWQAFFSTKGDSGGLGIGLASSKNIIEKDFNGQISAKSTPGEGTIFSLVLPGVTAETYETKNSTKD